MTHAGSWRKINLAVQLIDRLGLMLRRNTGRVLSAGSCCVHEVESRAQKKKTFKFVFDVRRLKSANKTEVLKENLPADTEPKRIGFAPAATPETESIKKRRHLKIRGGSSTRRRQT